jgi:NAD(P)-dependent dehydrogenase (short-subunit alcohol dehydrogenase family)
MQNLFDIQGKLVLVTGGSQGLGRMIADGLVGAGAHVIITSRKADVCESAVAELNAMGPGRCEGYPADLSTPEAAVSLVAQIRARHGKLDVLINNAGRTWGGPLETFPDKAWPSVMAVNVQGPFTLVRELLPLLKAAGQPLDPARVINIGSVAGSAVEPLSAYSYAASKAAIHHLSRNLAAELAQHHIAVNVIVPGYFPTRMTAHIRAEADQEDALKQRVPLGRMGTPEDIVGLCIFLSSRAGAYVTGAEMVIDGGMLGCR